MLLRATKTLVAFLVIVGVAVGGYSGVSALVERGNALGYEINVAARQRMLATRAAFYAHLLSENRWDDHVVATELRETLDLLEHSYVALRDGGEAPRLDGGAGAPVRKAPPAVQGVFREPPHRLGDRIEEFVAAGRRIADREGTSIPNDDPEVAELAATLDGPLLEGLEASIGAYERELVVATRQSRLLTALAVGGLVLVATAVLGLRAGRRRADIARRKAEAEILLAQKERYRALFEHSSDIVLLTDSRGRVLDVSSSVGAVLGVPDVDAVGRDIVEHVHPDERAAMRETFQGLAGHPGARSEVDVRIARPDGSFRTLHVVGQNLAHIPTVAGIVLNCHDVTERRAAEEDRQATEERFRAAIEGSFDSFAILEVVRDDDGKIVDLVVVDANSRMAEQVGRPRDEILGRRVGEIARVPELGLVERLAAVVESGISATDEVLVASGGRDATWFELTMVPIAGGVAVTSRDVTARKREQQELHYRAHHDVLTGLPNRAVLLDRLEYVLSGGGDPRVAVLFVDLDGFKGVNDAFGHEGGDTMLRQVADRLRSAVRAGDTVTRLGGDEFVVLCERVREPGEADEVAERVVEALHRPFPFGTDRISVGASVGVAVAEPGVSADALLRQADNAVYAAKRRGGGRVVRCGPELVEREPVAGS